MRGRTPRFRKALAVLAVVALIAALLVPAIAFARAGGGHVGGGSRSSGGSSSRSSGGGSSFGSALGGAAIGSALGGGGGGGGGCCGAIVVIIVIIVIVAIVMNNNKKGGGGGAPMTFDANAGEGDLVKPAGLSGDPFAEIKAADPAFSAELFYGRVNEMFIAIQYAWMNRNMEPVRRFLADQQFSVLQNGVQEYVLKGRINMLESVHITAMQPVEVTRQGDYDSVKMLITAACIDYTIDERTKELVNPGELGDGKTPTTFQEYWTFMRKAGAQSKVDASIQKCPNCGAPVTDGNYVKCAYCGMQMNDPTLDWVLMRIEQV